MYVAGVATREVAEMTKALCDTNLSKSQVSALVGTLEADPAGFLRLVTALCLEQSDE
jgi:transposase-like protein